MNTTRSTVAGGPSPVCPAHGTPLARGTCPRCRQEELAARREEQERLRRLLLLVFVPLLVFGLWLGLRPDQPKDVRLDPNPFRNAIDTVESVLYGGARYSPEDDDALRAGLVELEQGLSRTMPSANRQKAVEALQAFTARVVGETVSGRYPDVAGLREHWRGLRDAHFQHAAWFSVESAALREAESSTQTRGIPEDVGLYAEALPQLRQIAARVGGYFETLPQYEMASCDHAHAWKSTETDVRVDLERIRVGFPRRPADDGDAAWRRAWQALDKAANTVPSLFRTIANDGTSCGLPYRGAALNRVQLLTLAIDAAQKAIDAAPR